MVFRPQINVSAPLLQDLEAIAETRARLTAATIQVPWVPGLQKDNRQRAAHPSTAIGGNPLTLEEVRALEGGGELHPHTEHSRREVLNCFVGLRRVEKGR